MANRRRWLIIDLRQSSPQNRALAQPLEGYNEMIGALRLTARGLDPAIIDPLALEQVDLATPETQVLIFLNMMPYFVIMVIFVGGMHVVIDATAGEKERGSLEPLLINPVKRSEFVGCCWHPCHTQCCICQFTGICCISNLVPLEEFLGFQMTINVISLAKIFLLSLPMILLAERCNIIATFTRSLKKLKAT
jgi:sodium transport system permease protein